MFDEKPKNEDKPKNEQIRAELSMWRGLAVLLGIIVVCLIMIFFVIPHVFPPAVEIVKYCGDAPCKEQGVTLGDSFTAMFEFLNSIILPMASVTLGMAGSIALAGLFIRMVGGGK